MASELGHGQPFKVFNGHIQYILIHESDEQLFVTDWFGDELLCDVFVQVNGLVGRLFLDGEASLEKRIPFGMSPEVFQEVHRHQVFVALDFIEDLLVHNGISLFSVLEFDFYGHGLVS